MGYVVSKIVTLAASGLILLAGCGAAQSSGPLSSPAQGGRTILDAGSTTVAPGEPAVVTAWVADSTAMPVTLLSASLVPVHGYPAARLVHVGLVTNRNAIEGGKTWPPGNGIPVRPLQGAVVHRRGVVPIAFGISGKVVGRDYGAAGLKILYRYHGQRYTAMLGSLPSRASCRSPTGHHHNAQTLSTERQWRFSVS